MKKLLLIISILFTINALAKTTWPPVKKDLIEPANIISKEMSERNDTTPVCQWATKDYSSEGFGIPKRDGLYLKGQFGCRFYCGCNGKVFYVTHVYRNQYFDGDIFSKNTGGPKRAKWFICPHSVDQNSWKPMYDEYGDLIGYQVDEDKTLFDPSTTPNIPELMLWEKKYCQ